MPWLSAAGVKQLGESTERARRIYALSPALCLTQLSHDSQIHFVYFTTNNADLLREIFGFSAKTKPADSAVVIVFSYLA